MRVCQGFASRARELSSKPLISLVFFPLNLSSICHREAWVRVGEVSGGTSQQSYPQLLWVVSYDTEVLIIQMHLGVGRSVWRKEPQSTGP